MRPLLFGVLVSATAATLPAQGPSARVINVHVQDADSGLPLVRVRLTAAGNLTLPPTLTDEHGDAVIDPRGRGVTLRAAKPGYVPTAVPLPPDEDSLTIVLPRGAAISGRLTDSFGLPVAGIEVKADRDDPKVFRKTVKTDDLGEYRVGALPEGRYVVTAPGGSQTVALSRGSDVGGIDFAVSPRRSCPTVVSVDTTPALGSAVIQGRVTTVDGRPIACAEVAAFSGSARVARAVTRPDGTYAIGTLTGGIYGLEFQAPGYVTLQLSQRESGQPGRTILLRDREHVANVSMSLPRGGAITGTLLDEFYDPIEDVRVRALELRGLDERTMGVGAAQATTDDRGYYRLASLLPGRYVVVADAAKDPADTKTGKGYAAVYYPGTPEITDARRVLVQSEREQPFIDFQRVATRVVTVRGFAVDSNGNAVTDRVILVASQRSSAIIAETQGETACPPDGAFEITNVAPGDYVVQATSRPTSKDGAQQFGMTYVTVNDADPPPVTIRTQPGTTISGKLIQEGSGVDPKAFAVAPMPTDFDSTSVLASWQAMTMSAAGELRADALTGVRRFTLTAAPDDWYLKAVRVRGRDITDEAVDVRSIAGATDLQVVVSSRGASLSGSAPDTDYTVLLFSTNPARWFLNSRHVKTARSNGRGHFQISGIADGDYWVVALDPLDGTALGLWHNRAALETLVPAAQRVRLREGDARAITLAVTRR